MSDYQASSTQELHNEILELTRVHNLLSSGLFQGHQSVNLKEALTFIESLHEKRKAIFLSRPDCVVYEPSLIQGTSHDHK